MSARTNAAPNVNVQASRTRGNWNGHHWQHRGNGFGAGFAAGAVVGSSYPYDGGYGYYGNYGYGNYGYDNYAYDDSYPNYAYDNGGYDEGYGSYAAAPVAGEDRDDAYCAQRFQSYDPASGTYLGYDGARHPCP